MRKFEQLPAEDGLDLSLEALRIMCEARCPTLKQLIAKRDCTPRELWREICAERGVDECEPWQGWPAGPKRDFWENCLVPIASHRRTGRACSAAFMRLCRI
jgi:hypothetical protein